MKTMKRNFLHKIFISFLLVVVLFFFQANSVSQAKLKLKEGEFYYTGTQEGKPEFKESWWNTVFKVLAEIANYILGIMTLGVRGVIIGWIEIAEILLTAILTFESDAIEILGSAMTSYSQNIVNIESILFNKVEILDPNIFKELN